MASQVSNNLEPRHDPKVDVLVVGAGPTGLTAAAEALRYGMSVRIIDRKAGRGAFSKALVVHARTLEVFETMGVVDNILAEGVPFAALNARSTTGHRTTRVDLLGLGWGDTAYPYWLSVPQHATERVLQGNLERLGVTVEWSTTLLGLQDHGTQVEATLEGPSGAETVTARWVIGCDGGQSTVRSQAGIRLERTGAGATFLLADAKTTLDLVEDEGYVYLAPEGLLIIVPMPEAGRWRLIAHVPTPLDAPASAIDASRLDDVIRRRTGLAFGSHDVSWTSQFNLSHGVADRFRSGQVFLAGDAAHIHSPVGGQGLNTGVQDAHNLVWKLALARQLSAPAAEELLASYETERRGVAVPMVRGVARATRMLTAHAGLARRALGVLAPRALARPWIHDKLGRAVGMLELAYPVDRREARKGVGRRLGNPELVSGGRAYDKLDPTGFSWVVWGGASPDPREREGACWRGLPVVFLPDDCLAAPAGVPAGRRVMLVRPDRYVAAAGPDAWSVHGVLSAMLASRPEDVAATN
jgi:2-polyprenyl-6-methoxyphenol hydroxylase-like FAD-dependent oxidoreductase